MTNYNFTGLVERKGGKPFVRDEHGHRYGLSKSSTLEDGQRVDFMVKKLGRDTKTQIIKIYPMT
jgi:hypothetical protein